MKRLKIIIVLLAVLSVFPAISAQAAISISALTDFDVSGAPSRIAIGPEGKVYVSDSFKHRVVIFSNNGILLNSIEGIGHPIALDVDSSGNVYVGDADTGSVMVFDANGAYLTKLGAGDGEFIIPSALVVTSAGDVYVSDTEAGMVKAFTSGGNFSFGSGTFYKPTGIAVDETVSPAQLYIIDDEDGTGSFFGSRYVRVYGLNGNPVRNITLGGAFGGSTVNRPTGLRVDSSRLYVLDGLESSVTVLSKTGTLETRLGTLGTAFGELDVPTDMEFDNAGTLFVADYNNSRVNVYGVVKDSVASGTLTVSPSHIDFTIMNRDTVVSQDVAIGSLLPGVNWTAVSTEPWLGVSLASGTTPDVMSISAGATDLSSGTYSGQVQITSEDGILHVIGVELTVDLHVELFVSPLSLSFEYQSGSSSNGAAYPEQTLLIYSSGESVSWQATPNVDWVTLSSYVGTTPASVTVRLNSKVDDLQVNGFSSYNGLINITAGALPGSPADVTLDLEIHEAGTVSVSTNLDSSEYVLNGPQTMNGSGPSWTFENVTPGEYTLSFSYVEGYVRPAAQTFTVSSGETVEVNGTYRPVIADTGLVALSGAPDIHSADIVNFSGDYIGTLGFLPGTYTKTDMLDFAAGDIDGDGLSEVAFTDGRDKIEIYSSTNVLIGELAFPEVSEIRLAFADMDYDGLDDLIAGVRTGPKMDIDIYGMNSMGYLVRKFLYSDIRKGGDFAIAGGDIDGDGLVELLIAGSRAVRAYEPKEDNSLMLLWEQTGLDNGIPSLSVNDLDGDGTSEVIASFAQSKLTGARVFVMAGDGSGLFEFEPFADMGYTGGAYVTATDIDGDFKSEIIVGAGPAENNPSVVRIFEGDGTYTGLTFDALGTTSYGVQVKAGRF